jgi:hypothetical protein
MLFFTIIYYLFTGFRKCQQWTMYHVTLSCLYVLLGPNAPEKTAGANFEVYRTSYLLPHRDTAWMILHERLIEILNHCEVIRSQIAKPHEDLTSIEENLRKLVAALGRHIKNGAGASIMEGQKK